MYRYCKTFVLVFFSCDENDLLKLFVDCDVEMFIVCFSVKLYLIEKNQFRFHQKIALLNVKNIQTISICILVEYIKKKLHCIIKYNYIVKLINKFHQMSLKLNKTIKSYNCK